MWGETLSSHFGEAAAFGGVPEYNCTVPAKEIPTATTLGFDIFIIFGVLISYLPQWATIVYRKSSDGISVYFLFVGSLSAFWSVCNAVLLQYKEFACCGQRGESLCQKLLVNVYQLIVQWFSLSIVFFLFMVYFENRRDPALRRHWRDAKILSGAYLVIMAVVCVTVGLCIHVYGASNSGVEVAAKVMGWLSLVLVCGQYSPQILKTIKLRDAGAFSVPMLLVQCPGTAVWVVMLATATDSHVSTWLAFLVTAVFQFVLIVICCVFFARKWRQAEKRRTSRRRRRLGIRADGDDESEPLVVGARAPINVAGEEDDAPRGCPAAVWAFFGMGSMDEEPLLDHGPPDLDATKSPSGLI